MSTSLVNSCMQSLSTETRKFEEQFTAGTKGVDASKMPCSQKILGIIGDGQLGRMLAEAALKLGLHVKVLSKVGKQSSAGAICECVDGDIKNSQNVLDFAKRAEVVIPEIEHIDVSQWSDGGASMYPAPRIIEIIQDKFAQKEFFARFGIALGEYCDIPNKEALTAATEKFGFPCMLKSKRGAYDGRGNYQLWSLDDPNLESAITHMGGYGGIYLEKWQEYKKELAVIVVRGKDGTIKTYPVTETIQRNSICFMTETPAHLFESLHEMADQLARDAIIALNGVGTFGVEMFLSNEDKILLNEVAPRVHNSGHYTLNACVTSQFENHVRAALGWTLGDTRLTVPHVIMYNVLGEQDGLEGRRIADSRIASAISVHNCHPYWYAKAGEVKVERKVGHINIIGESQQDARNKLKKIDEVAFNFLQKTSPPAHLSLK